MQLRMKSFLGCMKLETGARILGCIDLTIYLLLTLLWAAGFGYDIMAGIQFDREKRSSIQATYIYFGLAEEIKKVSNDVYDLRLMIDMVITFMFTLIFAFGVYISLLLVRGCEKRSSSMIKPAIIVKAVMALFPISLTLFVAPVFLTFVLILVYEIAVLYALWEQLKVEEAQGLLQGHPKVAPPAYKEKSDVPYAVLAD